MQTCSKCGVENDDAAVFCTQCHHFLEWAAPERGRGNRRSGPRPTTRPPVQQAPPSTSPPEALQPESPPPHEEPEVTAPVEATAPVKVTDLIAAIDEGRSLAEGRQRTDLAERLDTVRSRLESRTTTAVVVGEFKRGKSTLVNALIQTAVCPVDADVVTAVPTLVRYGERVRLTSYEQLPAEPEPVPHRRPLESITALVSEQSALPERVVRSVEVQVPHRILRSGLCLLDTPGVGGLDSAQGQVSLGSVTSADCVLFVTDASQELTAPELEFLNEAVARCTSAALVITKTDIHPAWRRIADIDRDHLRSAGLDIPVLPVSSFLRLRAALQPALNEESGFRALLEFLATAVVVPGTARAAASAALDVDFVARQLAHESDAERVVLAKPAESQAVETRLKKAGNQALAMAAPSATWQQTLADGVQDLVSDIEHDLQNRLRTILRDVERVIDEGDPKDMWPDTEAWLRKQVAVAAVSNHDLLLSRAKELSAAIATQFDLETESNVELELQDVHQALERLELTSTSETTTPGGRLGPMVMAARISFLIPVMLFELGSIVMSAGATIPLAAASATVGAGVGAKLFKGESHRQRTYRQQTAKAAARKFIDDVAFLMNKETRDALRRTQRVLRDDLQARATLVHRSTTAALEAAQRASTLPPAGRAVRSDEVAAESERLQSIRTTMRELAGAGARAVTASTIGVGVAVAGDLAVSAVADVVDGPDG